MTIVSSANKIDACPYRPLVNVPNCRQVSFLNSAMTSFAPYPPKKYAASDVDVVE